MMPLPRLYAVADAGFGDPVHISQTLFRGGARLVQIRDKAAGARELLRLVETALSLAPAGAAVIVNDRVDVAQIAGAHGVHLGQTDLPAEEARRILGRNRIIGISTHNMEQAVAADALPVDYIAAGPVFLTTSKINPDPVLGLEGLAEICGAVRKPVVAIGGITLERAREVLAAGAASIAVIRDILNAPDVAARTEEWMKVLL